MTEIPAGRILISDSPGERRAAVLDADDVLRLVIHARLGMAEAGSLHLGRVTGRLPSGGAAFVDIGSGVPGFLNAGDYPGGLPAEGATVVVQVAAEARRGKGARLTAKVSFTDDCLAYTPQRPGANVSSKLPAETRARLHGLLAALLRPGEGAVVRTGATADGLPASLAAHRAAWQVVQARAAGAMAPLRLSPPPDVLAAALDTCPAPAEIVFDHRLALTAARAGHPALAAVMTAEERDLFAHEGIDEAIEAALLPEVPLPGGARLIIEPTAALVAVDVDAGPLSPAEANAAAAAALVGQLDLRGLAGQIVCDFVPDPRDKGRRHLLETLRRRLAAAVLPTHLAGVSPLGLVELRRDRGPVPLADLLGDGHGGLSAATIALAALRRAVWQGRAQPAGGPLALEAPVAVVTALRGPLAPALAEAEARLCRPLRLIDRPDLPPERVEVVSLPPSR